jgi:hypothetical protein
MPTNFSHLSPGGGSTLDAPRALRSTRCQQVGLCGWGHRTASADQPAAKRVPRSVGPRFSARLLRDSHRRRPSGVSARFRRRRPYRPRRLGKPSSRASPRLGCERIATAGSRASSPPPSCPALRIPLDRPARALRFPARAACAIDRPNGSQRETDRSVTCRFGVKSASAASRALVIRSRPSPRGYGRCFRSSTS